MLGRTFLEEEDTAGKDLVAMLSCGLWRNYCGGDPSLAGKLV